MGRRLISTLFYLIFNSCFDDSSYSFFSFDNIYNIINHRCVILWYLHHYFFLSRVEYKYLFNNHLTLSLDFSYLRMSKIANRSIFCFFQFVVCFLARAESFLNPLSSLIIINLNWYPCHIEQSANLLHRLPTWRTSFVYTGLTTWDNISGDNIGSRW